jgi:hypothetical protein
MENQNRKAMRTKDKNRPYCSALIIRDFMIDF